MFKPCDLCGRTQDAKFWPLHPDGGERKRCRKCVEAKGHPPATVQPSLDPDVARFREELMKRRKVVYEESVERGKTQFRQFYLPTSAGQRSETVAARGARPVGRPPEA